MGSSSNIYLDTDENRILEGIGDNSVLPLVFPIIQSRNILNRMNITDDIDNNVESMLALDDNSHGNAQRISLTKYEKNNVAVAAENSTYVDGKLNENDNSKNN